MGANLQELELHRHAKYNLADFGHTESELNRILTFSLSCE